MHLIVAALVQKDRCERTNFPCPEDQNSMHRRPRSLSIIPLCSIRQSFAFTSRKSWSRFLSCVARGNLVRKLGRITSFLRQRSFITFGGSNIPGHGRAGI